jgi:hypothetical protein
MRSTIRIALITIAIQSSLLYDAYSRQFPTSALGIVVGPISSLSLKDKQAQVGYSTNLVFAFFNLSVEDRAAFVRSGSADHLALTYVGIGYFQLFQVQGERYSIRMRSDITILNDKSPGFSDLYDRWGIFRKGIVLTAIADKSWRQSRPGWTFSVGVGVCL